MLHHMKDNIISLLKERPTAKEMMNALETKYGCHSNTQIQLLLDKFNNIKMNEGDVVGDHVNQLELITKELADAGHTLSDKMQVTAVLNSCPPSWDHVVTSLTHSCKELAMTTLLYKFKHKWFKKQWTKKLRQENKPRDACYRCGERGHYKINCPLNKRPKNKGKEIAMTITAEALVIESPSISWWVDSAATRYIARNRELFVDLKEKQLGKHRVYMGNNTYSDLLGEGRCKFSIGDFVIVLNNVLYVPSIHRNLISVPVLNEKGFEVKMKSGRVFISKGDLSVFGVKVDDADDSGRKRQRQPSSMLKDYYLMESKVIAIEDDLANFAKAMESHYAKPWLKAMNEALDLISKNEVWDLTELPAGVDFVDTYSPVAKFASVRIIMVVAARLDLELYQLDVKTAFLNGDLKEEIYMDQSDGFQIKGQEGKVCRLKKSLYGLKQSSRQWYLKFHQAILDIGYEMSPLDHCVYVWRDKEKLTLLSLYVDDILLASNSSDMMKETKFCLGSKFEMKDIALQTIPVSTTVSKGTILNKIICPTNKTELEEMIAVPYAPSCGQSNVCNDEHKTRYMLCSRIGKQISIQSWQGALASSETNIQNSGFLAKYTMEAEYIACNTAVSNAVWIKRFVDNLKLDIQDKLMRVGMEYYYWYQVDIPTSSCDFTL
uniref:CCHC-type domain-containing protein n=1 Tax=Fagus sylvatica TaxID=28930 RepID=A0A2N9FGY8_FAGSY